MSKFYELNANSDILTPSDIASKANSTIAADEWSSTKTDYKVGNYVTLNGNLYKCIKDNPTATDTPEVASSQYWHITNIIAYVNSQIGAVLTEEF